MAETIDFRLGRVPDIRQPIGANFSAAFAFTGIDLTGYTATLAAKASGKDQLSAWSKSGITVGATSIAFDISPATLDDNSVPFAVATSGYLTGYSLTVYDSGSVVMRIQGEIEWIPDVGDFETTTAASSSFSVSVSAAVTAAITVTGGGSSEVADGSVTLAKLADLTEATVLGRPLGAGTGPVVALTGAEQRAAAGLGTGDSVSVGALATASNGHITILDSGALRITGTGTTNHTSFSGIGNWYGNTAFFATGVGIVGLVGQVGSGRNGISVGSGHLLIADIFLTRIDADTIGFDAGAGVWKSVKGSNLIATQYSANGITTVASLLAAATYPRYRIWVSDSTVAASGNFAAIVAGGGSNTVEVKSNGTDWVIC